MTDKKTVKGSIAALLTNIIFGFSFLFSKIALDYAHPMVILAVRFTVAFAVLNLMWLFGTVKLDFKGKSKKKLYLMALAQPLLYFIFELYGIENTSSALSGVIISLVPVAVIILSTLFLKEKPTLPQILFSVLSLAAIAVISMLGDDGGANRLVGILLLLGAVVCAAVFNVLSRSESERFSPFERTYIMFLVGAVGFNTIAAFTLRGQYITELVLAASYPQFWAAVCYLAIVSSIVAFMLYNYSTTVISSVRSASFSNLITVVSVLAGVFILGETMSAGQFICCALIIVGVFGVNR